MQKFKPFLGYAFALVVLALATLVGWLVRPVLEPINLALIYLLAVVVIATTHGLGPAVLASILAVLVLDALFVPPYGVLSVRDPQDLLTCTVFLVVGVLTSELGSRLRMQAQLAQARARQTAALYVLSQEIAFRSDRNLILNAALEQIRALFRSDALILLPDAFGELAAFNLTAARPHERTLAQWVYVQGQPAQSELAGGVTLLPLRTAQGDLGVLIVRRTFDTSNIQQDERRTLDAFATQMAVAFEHVKLAEQADQAHLLQANERFHEALLSSLSHDLRTPITAIVGAATSLLDETAQLDEAERRELLTDIDEQSARLNRLVGNLLEMTRLESRVQPQRAWHSLPEVIDAALTHVKLGQHRAQVHLAPALPLISFDFVLIEQVLLNLIENAVKFSPPQSPIEITAECQDNLVEVAVADRGVGIPTADLERVFDKFYRVRRNGSTAGNGLGLMICRGIVEAHSGTIRAERRVGGGTRIAFTLPAKEQVEVL